MKTSSLWLRAGLALALMLSVAILLPTPAAAGTKAQIQIEQAKVAFSDKDYAGALALLNGALAEEPNNGEALQYAGLCELGLGKTDEAVQYLQKAAAAMPKDPGVRENLAQALLTAKQFDAALAAADEALAIDPTRGRASLLKGEALIGLKRNEEAVKVLAAVEGPSKQAAQFYAGTAEINLGRTQDSVPYFKQAKALGPDTELGRKSEEYLAGGYSISMTPTSSPWPETHSCLPRFPICRTAGPNWTPTWPGTSSTPKMPRRRSAIWATSTGSSNRPRWTCSTTRANCRAITSPRLGRPN